MDNTEHTHTVLSLCSGYGGIELGLGLAGVKHRTVAYVEIEAFQCQNLVDKMQAQIIPPAAIWSNLKTLPVEPFRNRIDILTGGYPCQPFSAAGKRAGKDDPRHLWPYIADIIRSVRPVRCFFENVEGHISLGLREVISDLESLGYQTAWGIFSATLCGARHQRKRVYIMADASSEGLQGHNEHQGHHATRQAHAVSDGYFASQGASCGGSATRTPEPFMGRMVDGYTAGLDCTDWGMNEPADRIVQSCEHRVDRIRSLGNGVVPATACDAWIMLDGELKKHAKS